MSLDISTFVQLASADNNLAAPVSAVPLAEPTQASPAPASDAAPSQGTEQDTIGPVLDTPTMTAEAADEVFGALDPLHERWSLPL